MSEATAEPKPRLCWYQYRLAHLFVFVTICAIPCSWFACQMAAANKRKATVEAIEELDGWVAYDYQCDANDNFILDAQPPGPEWFRNLVGVDFVADVVYVDLGHWRAVDLDLERLAVLAKLKHLDLTATKATNADLVHLKEMHNLTWLDLRNTKVDDAGLAHLTRLPKLKDLTLGDGTPYGFPLRDGINISDAGLKHLEQLTSLRSLDIGGTDITYDSCERLRKTLPNCQISGVFPE